MRRSLLFLSLGALLIGVPNLAAAQPSTAGLAGALVAADLATSDLASEITESSTSVENAKPILEVPRSTGRSSLVALSVASATLHGLDVYTTLAALDRGALEANPMMRGAVRNTAVFVAVKSSMAAATIYAAHRLWPRNRVAAVAVLAISNGVMATVVAHNLSVLRQMK
jgi:hypothetical protein